MKKPLLYIAGPISAYRDEDGNDYSVEDNIRIATDIVRDLMKEGYFCICPHLERTGMQGDLTHKQWIDRGLRLLSMCDVVCLLPNHEYSKGTSIEVDFARIINVPCYYYRDIKNLNLSDIHTPMRLNIQEIAMLKKGLTEWIINRQVNPNSETGIKIVKLEKKLNEYNS